MSRAKCYYCSNMATGCCEHRLSGVDKLKTCPRAVCDRHSTVVGGLLKCYGHALPPDDAKKPWES